MDMTDINCTTIINPGCVCHKGVDVACFSEDPTTTASHLPLLDDQSGSKYIKLFAPIVVIVVYHLASPCKFINRTTI